MLSVLVLVASVVVGAPFGVAEASAISDSDGLTVEITVQYGEAAEAVIARPYSEFEELPPTALSDLGNGTYGGLVELPTAENWFVAFEAFRADGEVDLSDGVTLTEMGVDPVVVDSSSPTEPVPADPLIPPGGWWLIAGIVLAVAALVTLAFWTFTPGDQDAEPGGSQDA